MLLLLLMTACSGDGGEARETGDGAGSGSGLAPDASSEPGTGCGLAERPEVRAWSLPQVRSEEGRLVDAWGREVRIHGVNARIEGLFDVVFDDGRERLQPLPEWHAGECAAMARQGFNMLRLPINWSGIEPEEGAFDQAYLERVDQVIDDCREAGVYVLVDLHQDAWSKHIGEDGAPLWAIVPPPPALLEGPLDEEELNRRRTSAPVLAAFESFWANRENIQDRWMPMWRLVVERWTGRPEVIGFQPMNEPVFSGAREERLWAFHVRAVEAMREINTEDPFWFEPDALRNFLLSSPKPSQPLLGENVVYAPHFYPGLAGVRADDQDTWERRIRRSIREMREEAEAWGAALVVGEWGDDPQEESTAAYVRAFHRVVDEMAGGHALWLWKENSQGSWGLFDFDDGVAEPGSWVLRETEAVRAISPPHVIAVPGRLDRHAFAPFDEEDGATEGVVVRVAFTPSGNECAGPVLYLPLEGGPWQVLLDGAPATGERDTTSGRFVVDWPDGRGESAVLEVRPAQAE